MNACFRLTVMFAITVLVSSASCLAQVPASPNHKLIMDNKLTAAQKVMAGIAREDFAEIRKQAQMLTLLSHEAGWNVVQTPEYIRLSGDFRGTTTQLKKAAEAENMDAVGLAFVKFSISCIECHRHAKEELARVGDRRNSQLPLQR